MEPWIEIRVWMHYLVVFLDPKLEPITVVRDSAEFKVLESVTDSVQMEHSVLISYNIIVGFIQNIDHIIDSFDI